MVNRTHERNLFVWVHGLVGPEPQKWFEVDFELPNAKRRIMLAWQMLTAEESGRPIDELAQIYPLDKCMNPKVF
jgi:hypothetical protein